MARRDAGTVSIDRAEEGTGVLVTDPIERCQYTLGTSDAVSPVAANPDAFPAPVDAAVEFTAERLTLPRIAQAFVRDDRGEMVLEVSPGTERDLPDGVYDVELDAPVKLYLRAPGPLRTTAALDELAVEFADAVDVLVGARSYHQHPAATITTTAEPTDLMRAITHLGSALKTTSPERSFPTLRGHPPLLAVGDRFDVPAGLSPPDTDVRIEVPPALAQVLVVAPLAYYLGARVVAGERPRLVTDAGFEHPLDGPEGFERRVERTLKQTFLLDCCTRTEGLYRVSLDERAAIESAVDLDFATLYDCPLAERLAAYLAVPYETVEPHLPTWAMTAHLPATADGVEALPFVVDELGIVRRASGRRLSSVEVRSAIVGDYSPADSFRASEGSGRRRVDGDDATPALVDHASTDSFEEAWFGEHAPIHGTKSSVTAFHNALDREPKAGPIDVTVVCNGEVNAEARDVVDDIYGSRDELEFDVSLHHDCSTAELRGVLESGADFCHYVGHIDDDGVLCRDGHLDVGTLDSVGVDAFLLNGCRSYDQGVSLIEAGSLGGVVTIADVVDSGAITVGRSMARLLNLGFPLRSALSVARKTSVVGGHYLVVGNGRVAIAQLQIGSPMVCTVESIAEDEYSLTIHAHLSADGGMGSMVYPAFESNDRQFLYPGTIGPVSLSRDQLRDYVAWHAYPVCIDGEWFWRENDGAIEDRLF